jgi:hypothetical protein
MCVQKMFIDRSSISTQQALNVTHCPNRVIRYNCIQAGYNFFIIIFCIHFEMLQEKTRFKLRIIGGNYENF